MKLLFHIIILFLIIPLKASPLVNANWLSQNLCKENIKLIEVGYSYNSYLVEHIKCSQYTNFYKDGWRIKSNKVAMSLSDLFCVERHKQHFLDLVKNKLDIVFANEQEIFSLLNTQSLEEVISFSKQQNKNIIITRGDKGAIAVKEKEVYECNAEKDLKITDLTGAGDLFAAGYLDGIVKNKSIKECLKKGTELSSKIIQKVGARI